MCAVVRKRATLPSSPIREYRSANGARRRAVNKWRGSRRRVALAARRASLRRGYPEWEAGSERPRAVELSLGIASSPVASSDSVSGIIASRALRRGRCVEGVASRGVASRVLRRGRRVEVRVSSASCHVVSRRRSSRVVSRRRASHFDVAHAHSSCRDNHSNCAASPELVALQRGRRFRERYSVVPTCRRHQSRASLLDVARADSPSRDGGREHGVPRHPLAPSASMAPSTATAPSTGCALSSACLPLSRSAPARRPGGLTP